ncbi:GntR family transcriptional regulator [Streptomyces sp. RS2]|uniref:GntR family transcriptional regulator n=1 Tax=Streptomyces sp. RS2 TaxID=1451205 RepID=UPI0021F8BBAD|nr:GntR family transcriptional regulator [Streptomyces sp. RS2]MCW1100271.1 GntR family transcriptional regulator [Streptomyces sp. RS2]
MVEENRHDVLTDRVYEAVKAMVMDHEIAPGTRVSIDGLARRLDVSATPVREALARLESDRLVVKRPNAGYRATELLDPEALTDLFEMRLLLEPRAASLAAENAGEEDLRQLRTIVDEMRHHPESGAKYSQYRQFTLLDQDFHDALAYATGRPLLAEAVTRLHSHLHMFRLNSAPGAAGTTINEHERIVDAIAQRNPEKAAEAMAAHLRSSRVRHRPHDPRPRPSRRRGTSPA